MQMTFILEGSEGTGKVQLSVVRNLLDSVLVQADDRQKGMDILIRPQESSYTHLTHGANVHEDWDVAKYY